MNATPHLAALLFSLLSVGILLAEEPAPAEKSVDDLGQDDLQKLFGILRERHVQRADLGPDELNRAAMQGLLERLGFGAELLEQKADDAGSTAAPAFVAETIAPGIGYLRPAFDEAGLESATEALGQFADEDLAHLILDLRIPGGGENFQPAADLAELLSPARQPLFEIQHPEAEEVTRFESESAAIWEGDLVLLVDASTGPLAEVVGAALRAQPERHVLAIGEATSGRAVLYETTPVREGLALRFAVAEVLLPGGETLFRKGITPEVVVELEPAVRDDLGARFAEEGVARWSAETPRERFSEAALVAGVNPEIDYAAANHGRKPPPAEKRDTVVQRAVDIVSARTFLEANDPE